jgi:uncharacterized RDD family membrane protein YckC
MDGHNTADVFVIEGVPLRKKITSVDGIDTEYDGFVDVVGVTSGTRFGYFIIDRIVSYLFALLVWAIILVPDVIFNESAITNAITYGDYRLLDNVGTYIFILFLYYFVVESIFGTSIGKLILGYIVVDAYGNKPTIKQLFKRSVSRLVPFEAFSCFKWKGWHDEWSDTMVISKKELADLRTMWEASKI